MKPLTAIRTRLDDLEARRPALLQRKLCAALRQLSDAELERLEKFAMTWDGDDAQLEAVFVAYPGTREAVARFDCLVAEGANKV